MHGHARGAWQFFIPGIPIREFIINSGKRPGVVSECVGRVVAVMWAVVGVMVVMYGVPPP